MSRNGQSLSISVVIPAFNAERHIARAIRSVLAQTRPAEEIIVVDDGSTDGTAEAVRTFGDAVRLIQQPNAGASVARNTGIEAAIGDWIAFLDADDEWIDDYLKKQTALLAQNPTLNWTAANFWKSTENGTPKKEFLSCEKGHALQGGKAYFDDYFWAFTHGATGWTGTKLIRKDALVQAGLFMPGQPMANDLDMWWRIAYRHPTIGYIPEPLAIYHLDVAESITKIHRNPAINADLIERHLNLARELNCLKRFKPCAIHYLRFWMTQFSGDERRAHIRPLMRRFGYLFPPGFRIQMYLLSRWPRLTRACLPYFKIMNKILRIPT